MEQKLNAALTAMATQQHLSEAILKVTANQPHRRFVGLRTMASSGATNILVSAVLEPKLEELHLQRTGKNDESFALRVKARARAIRVTDGQTLFDESFEQQSGTGLFLDWSLGSTVQNVAETCYRRLAERMTERLIGSAREETALLGAGFRKPYLPPAPAGQLHAAAGVLPASYRMVSGTVFGVYATSAVPNLVIQAPLTKNEALREARSDLQDGQLGELIEFRNPTVSVLAIAAAIPIGLVKQGNAAIRGLTEANFRKADQAVRIVAHQTHLHDEIALALVEKLAPQTSQAIALVPRPTPTGDLHQAALLQCAQHGTLTALPRHVTARDYLASQGHSQAIEVRVTQAVLKGNGGVNPPLALHLEAIATVHRVSDGQALFVCPLRYQSRARKYEEWARDAATPLRAEMQTCFAELGQAITTQLLARQVLPPKQGSDQLIAATAP